MTSIYLIRHAQSQGNLSRRFQGRLDTPLTELGQKQARAVGLRFRAIPLHAVYASPLIRAMQTAQAIADVHGLRVSACDDMIEMRGGAMENMAIAQLQRDHPQQFSMFDARPHLFEGLGDAEPIIQVYERAVRAIDTLVAAHPGQNVAVVSHGLPIRCCACHARGATFEQLGQTLWAKNTGVYHITYHEGAVIMHRENDLSHLGDDLGAQEWGSTV